MEGGGVQSAPGEQRQQGESTMAPLLVGRGAQREVWRRVWQRGGLLRRN